MDSETRRHLVKAFLNDLLPEDFLERDESVPPGSAKPSVEFAQSSAKTSPGRVGETAVAKKAPPKRFHRRGNLAISLIALAFISISAYGFFYHREKLAAISAEHIRLFVTGPSVIQAGLATDFTVFTTSLDGRPLSADVEAALSGTNLSGAAAQPLKTYRARSDERGRLKITIPAELQLPPDTRLVVAAWQRNGSERETAETTIAVVPTQLESHITLDKPRYRPGETVHYRSLTLFRFALTADRARAVQFEIFDSAGVGVPKSLHKATTDQGVAGGEFVLPDSLTNGRYTLAVRGDGSHTFPAQQQAFWVRRAKSMDWVKTAANDSGDNKINVTFFPEGGKLVANVENRVYFVARTAAGKPTAISGQIVGRTAGERARTVATVQTTCDGRGAFSFVPRAGAHYRVKISDPAGAENEPALPETAEDEGAAINVGAGVFAAGAPLQFVVRTAKAGMPLIAAAYCRGVQVGEQMFETKGGDAIDNSVELHLDEAVGGVVRLAVYDYSAAPPMLVAERLVYRRPGQKLNVTTVENEQTGENRKRTPSGKLGNWTLSATDENAAPTPAVVWNIAAMENATASDTPSESAFFLLTDDLDARETLKDADFYLSDQTRGKTPAAAALDLLLAAQRRPTTPCPPPLVYDNLRLLHANYEQSLAEYRADRSPWLNALTAASFFGSLGLVVLAAMATLFRIASGTAWISALAAAACCLTVGSMLMTSDRQAASSNAAAFFSYRATPPSPKEETHVQPPPESADASQEHSGKTVLWKPATVADGDGRATISIESSDAPLTVTIDAHGAGRFGSARLIVPPSKK